MQGHKQSERRISEWSGLNWRSGCISETDSSKPQTTTWEQSVVNWDAGSLKTRLLLDVLWRKRLTGRLNQKWTKYAKLEQGTRGDQGARGVEGTGPDEETNALAHGVGRGILQVKRNVTSPKKTNESFDRLMVVAGMTLPGVSVGMGQGFSRTAKDLPRWTAGFSI
ncbi:hypothetical protein CEP52_006686 [Fusarium oligoseptatum]|uniref:Uncharacterized protein n=1 Tax=Fusarium oligoseptatum TaxID=2604345 RepID=A0A428TRM5_9HYPO|nr:hypothetical protein CEP52_006686 [Fusarium oligoseptatum]